MKHRCISVIWGLCLSMGVPGSLRRGGAQPPLPQQRGDFADHRPQALPVEESLKKARVNGKYAMLLRQIEVREDVQAHTNFDDFGIWQGTEWAGYTDLPPGYWVYVYPYWYIWRDLAANAKPQRNWGPEQATGPPNTLAAGHAPTAWASSTPDGQDEWLLLEYEAPVTIKAIKFFESNNPGAVTKIGLFTLQGKEVTVFAGQAPTPLGGGPGVATIPVQAASKSNRIKLYLDSKNRPGWNEIDAVGIVDEAGATHWATAAEAGTTCAEPNPPVEVNPPQVDFPGFVPPRIDRVNDNKETEARLAQLEAEMQQLKATIEALQEQLRHQRQQPPPRP